MIPTRLSGSKEVLEGKEEQDDNNRNESGSVEEGRQSQVTRQKKTTRTRKPTSTQNSISIEPTTDKTSSNSNYSRDPAEGRPRTRLTMKQRGHQEPQGPSIIEIELGKRKIEGRKRKAEGPANPMKEPKRIAVEEPINRINMPYPSDRSVVIKNLPSNVTSTELIEFIGQKMDLKQENSEIFIFGRESADPEEVKKFFAIITFEYASTAKYCISAINRKMYKGNRKNEITVKMVEYHPNRQVYANIPSEALSSKTPIDNFNQIVFWNSTEHKIKSMSSTVAWDKTTPIDLRNEMVQAIVSRISVHLYKGYLVKIVKRRKNGHFKVVFETDPLSGEEFEKASATRQANDLAKAEHWAVCNAYKSRRHAGSTNAIIVVSYVFAEVNSPDRLKLFVGTLLHELLHAYGVRKEHSKHLDYWLDIDDLTEEEKKTRAEEIEEEDHNEHFKESLRRQSELLGLLPCHTIPNFSKYNKIIKCTCK